MQLFALTWLLAAAAADSLLELQREEWTAFKLEHGKAYGSAAEERARAAAFAQSRLAVARHNQRHALGLETFRLGLNRFADLTTAEFARAVAGSVPPTRAARPRPPHAPLAALLAAPRDDPPRSKNWVEEHAVTPVKDQGACRSCWAFAAAGALEGQRFLKTSQLEALSEQDLVDCAPTHEPGAGGCKLGHYDDAFVYMHDHGVNLAADYPYKAAAGPCRHNASGYTVYDVGFADLPSGEEALKEKVAFVGPVAVAVDTNHDKFRLYHSGVLFIEDCSDLEVNHAMLVVGYGTDEAGGDYWLVKNSWGRSWGEQGYVKMARNRNNNCGIASYPAIPAFGY